MYMRAGTNAGYDITPLFRRTAANDFPACIGQSGAYATSDDCTPAQAGLPACPLGALSQAALQNAQITNSTRKVGYAWEDLAEGAYPHLIVSGWWRRDVWLWGSAPHGRRRVAAITKAAQQC
jgi:hypothetical protein